MATTVFTSLSSTVSTELWQIQACLCLSITKNIPRTQKFESRSEQITQLLLIYFPSEFPLGTKACVMKVTNQTEVRHIYEQKRKPEINILSKGNINQYT